MTLDAKAYFYGLAGMAYLSTCLVAAAVRWFHMCHPYNTEKEYYYPDRPLVTLFLSYSLFIIPYIVNPLDQDSWLLVKGFFLIFQSFFCAVLIFNYFGTIKQWHMWKKSAVWVGLIAWIVVFWLFARAVVPGLSSLPPSEKTLLRVIIGTGLLTAAYGIIAIIQVRRWIFDNIKASFSNREDFPVHYARSVLWFPVVHFLLLWSAILMDSKMAFSVVLLVLSVLNTLFLILILHPQREKDDVYTDNKTDLPTESEIKGVEQTTYFTDNVDPPFPIEKLSLLIEEIERVVVKEKGYLNEHLTLKQVADECSSGRTYISWVFKNRLGGFYEYVNRLRIQHACEWEKEHPGASKAEVAQASGFGTRQTYHNALKKLCGSKDKNK